MNLVRTCKVQLFTVVKKTQTTTLCLKKTSLMFLAITHKSIVGFA